MPTGTKIAVIVLVVLLGAAGLYYAFVPPTSAPKFDASKGAGTTSTETPRSTLPSGGLGMNNGASSGTNPTGTSPTGTTPSLNELIERQRLANGAGTTPGTVTGTDPNTGATTGASTTAPGGSLTAGGANTAGTTSGTTAGTTTGTTTGITTGSTTGTPFRNGTPVQSSGTAGSGLAVNTGAAGQTTPGAGQSTTGTASNGTAGNTAGTNSGSGNAKPTKVADASPAGDNATTHIVKKGETMASIAKSRLGSANKWQLIAKANPTVDPNAMKIGTKLRLPNAPTTAGASVASAPTNTAATKSTGSNAQSATTGGTHVVAKGETLSSIAKKHYGDSKFWKAIASANPKINANSLSVGSKLSIPPKSAVASGETADR